jgi:type I restriction enzyme S subunit
LDLTGREVEIEALGEGSTGQTELPRSGLALLPVLVPSKQMQDRLDNVASPILNRIKTNLRESKTLAEIRDLLLPKLMSGEIRVREAEKIAENAA